MESRAQPYPRPGEDDRRPIVVSAPSPHIGVAQALRASYGVGNLPPEIARLVAKLS